MARISLCFRAPALAALALAVFLSCSPARAGRAGAALTVHYYRYAADYSGWNVWVWPADPPGEGRGFAFSAPGEGGEGGFVSARVDLPQSVKEFGMIIRKSDERGDWAERDGGTDRFSSDREV